MPTASQLIKNNLLTTDTCRCASNALGQKKTRQAIVQSCLAAFWIVAGCVGVGQQKIYRHTSNLQHATLASVGRRFLGAHKWRKAKKKNPANGQHVYVFKQIQFAIIWQANQVEISMRFPPVAGVIIRGHVFGHKSSDLQLFLCLVLFRPRWKIEKQQMHFVAQWGMDMHTSCARQQQKAKTATAPNVHYGHFVITSPRAEPTRKCRRRP